MLRRRNVAEAAVEALVIDPREHAGCLNPRLRKIMKKQKLPPLQAWHIFFPPDVACLELETKEQSIEKGEGDIDTQKFLSFVNQSQVVLGLHPDEATESIVDWAIAHQRGFCIVPCCVFARLFPDRHLSDSSTASGFRQVRTHQDLCTYLLRKHKGIRCTELSFEGMNKCLWATAEDLVPSSDVS